MIEIYTLADRKNWDNIVKKFTEYDIYYLSGYVKAFQQHGDGEPILIYYKSDNLTAICVMMKRDISLDPHFKGKIPENKYFDLITPYGYGGFILEGDTSEENIKIFYDEYIRLLESESIVSVFVRYHPQLGNAKNFKNLENVIDLGKTVEIELTSNDNILKNMTSKNRTHIRRASKKGVVIKHGKSWELFEKFIAIYNQTMKNDKADEYYYFDIEFYKSIYNDLNNNFEIFYAELNNKIISMSIILFANGRIHYHLSGSNLEYRRFSPSNLLLYKVACWGVENDYKTFHLGGGLGSKEDGLFKFKKAFNRHDDLQFSISKHIVNHEEYNFLTKLRTKNDKNFNLDSSFFPLYRS